MFSAPYSLRLATRDDLPLLGRWLRTPEVVRWWGDPVEQQKLLSEDIDDPRMVTQIVEFEERPFAYAQDYDVSSWPQSHLSALPPGTRAIDAFIGEPEMIGRGHGSRFLRLLAQRLRERGIPCVAIDPDPDNLRALRAYGKAGFRTHSIHQTEEGMAAVMLFDG